MIPPPKPAFDDAAARERIRHKLDESLLVEASAGTGKTSELVRRIVATLETGRATIDRIVAVTFTNKAAGELKLRLRQELDRRRAEVADGDSARNLEHALARLEEASIGTIHAFCGQILRERPVEALVDPAFEELTDRESGRLYDRVFREWLRQKLGEQSPGLRRGLTRLAWRDPWDDRPPMEQLADAGKRLIEWRDFPAPWRREPFDRDREIGALLTQVRELAELARRARRVTDPLRKSLLPAAEFVERLERGEASGALDNDTLEALLLKLLRDIKRHFHKGSGKFSDYVAREDVLIRSDALLDALERFKLASEADLATELRDELREMVELHDEGKRRAGKLDFVDLLILARNLVRDNAEVRRYLQDRFTRIFVDEFQDTDPLQAEILLLLAAADPNQTDWLAAEPAPGKLFVVGDPKQSIYKFRRADVVLYQAIREALTGRGVGLVHLTRSFRAVRPIQDCVNAAFEPEMTGDATAGQASWVPLEEHAPAPEGQPSVIALPAPKPYGKKRLSKEAINDCLPSAVGGFVAWLINDSGWTIRDPENPGQRMPIAARHVALLFRRFLNRGEDVSRDYVRDLEARNIPHLLVGSRAFHRREEVETVRAALAAVEWPDDELSVFAALKGSLFALPDSILLRFRLEIGALHPFRPLPDSIGLEFRLVCDALEILAELHRRRNYRPVAETLNRLLEATRAHAGFGMRPAGHQALANVHRIADLARGFESEGGISFRAFVAELASEAARADSVEAPVLEEGADGVRLMTVHSAKGLEFPVVILADMTANLAALEPERHVDGRRALCANRLLRCAPWELIEHEVEEKERERAEGVRVAYVAATRARDLLVVPVVGDEERDGWLGPLNKALYPAKDAWRHSRPAPGCPAFGEASVLARPDDFDMQPEFSVKPGLHAPRTGTHAVVWWDPRVLSLVVEENFGLRQQEILEGAPGGESMQKYTQWKDSRERAVAQGSHPAWDVILASETSAPPPGFRCEVAVEHVPRTPTRPAGARFGALVHGLLRDAALARDEAFVSALAASQGRLLGAPDEEIDAAVAATLAAIDHPLLARARTAARVHRELPINLRLDHPGLNQATMLEGVADLAFVENGAWVVVDFKTDADLATRLPHYEAQVQWYALALSRVTGLEVSCRILSV